MSGTGPQVAVGAHSLQARIRRLGLWCGPLLAALVAAVLPDTYHASTGEVAPLTTGCRATLALMAWMATWWMTEAVEIEVTALLPVALFPLLGVLPIGRTTACYGSDVVLLFLGGFVLAAAIARWGLDRRIALATLRIVGTGPRAIVGGTMAATAFLSMWVSNTATAAMMVPIVTSLVDVVVRRRTGRSLAEQGGIPEGDRDLANFARAAMLGVAYAASIGGVGTLIGSPPNALLARFVEQKTGRVIDFADWLWIGLPVVLTFLPLAWWLLSSVLLPTRLGALEGGREYLRAESAKLGPFSRGERATLWVFAGAVLLWSFGPLLGRIEVAGIRPLAGLSDAGVAIGAAVALFVWPVDRAKGTRAMDWATAVKLPWGVLILFGGGLALAQAADHNGVPQVVGGWAGGLAGWHAWAVLLLVITAMVFLSELTSNTAQVATMLPILAALAPALGFSEGLLLVPATVAASLAFMMPVGTPPNAIVFGTGLIRMPHMLRAGLWLNLAGIALIFALTWLVFEPVLASLR
jgi:sodium-dependent dicarboxylate transporter 2/3/5